MIDSLTKAATFVSVPRVVPHRNVALIWAPAVANGEVGTGTQPLQRIDVFMATGTQVKALADCSEVIGEHIAPQVPSIAAEVVTVADIAVGFDPVNRPKAAAG